MLAPFVTICLLCHAEESCASAPHQPTLTGIGNRVRKRMKDAKDADIAAVLSQREDTGFVQE